MLLENVILRQKIPDTEWHVLHIPICEWCKCLRANAGEMNWYLEGVWGHEKKVGEGYDCWYTVFKYENTRNIPITNKVNKYQPKIK